MLEWWNNLDLISQIYALIAIPSTLILIIQTVVLFIGIGDDLSPDASADVSADFSADVSADPGDLDGDFDSDDVSNGNDGMSVFTLRGMIAMLCVGGWSGLAMLESGVSPVLAIILSTIFGAAALLLIGYMMYLISKLQSNGNISLSNALGKCGTVYIPVPPNSSGKGKITVTVQDTLIEVDAVTTVDRKIATGETVRVVATDETGTLVVEPVNKKAQVNA